MLEIVIAFLVMLNPFALFLYLEPVWKGLSESSFRRVLFEASLISFGIFAIFLLIGDLLFQLVFRINFESFRIFGGIILFSFAYLYIVKGQKAMIQTKENLDDLASEIALPFMVGAGTISLTIIMSHDFGFLHGLLLLALILSVNYVSILLIKVFRENMPRKKMKVAFDKNMEILLRLTGFFLGSIGINMIITGIQGLAL